MRTCWVLASLLCALALNACNDMSAQEYADLVDEARACGGADTCVLAGAGECTCATPVNASEEGAVNEAAADFDCEKVETADRCSADSNVRCEAGRCVSDESP